MKTKMVAAVVSALALALTFAAAPASAGGVWSSGSVMTDAGFAGMGTAGSNGGFIAGGDGPGVSTVVGGIVNTQSLGVGLSDTSALAGATGNATQGHHTASASVNSQAATQSYSVGNVISTTGAMAGGDAAAVAAGHHH